MEIAEKIQLTFEDLDQERILSVATTCFEMMTSLRLDLAFCKKDQHKLKIIQSKQKEAQDKIKEFAIKSQYAVNLYNQHLNVEYNKAFSFQPSNLPDTPDNTSIFNVKIFEYLQANLISQKNQLADFTFVFRRMQKDEFIYEEIKEKTFRDFLSRHFEIEIENKLKPEGYNITDSKEKMYSNALSLTRK